MPSLRLPAEAQIDRFMLKVRIGYPSREKGRRILNRMASSQPLPEVRVVTHPQDIAEARGLVSEVFVDEKVRDYIVELVQATRPEAGDRIPGIEGMIEHGAGPRASIWLMLGVEAHAFLQGRGYVTPQDVKTLAPDILRHRVGLSYEAEAEGIAPEAIIQRILDTVLVP